MIRAAAAQGPQYGPSYLTYLDWLYRGLAEQGGSTLVAWDGSDPVAALTVVPGPHDRRFQEVWTTRTYRRRGLATALIATALRQGGTHLLASVVGSDALRVYLRLGFRPVSRVYEVSRANE